jgi:hypothetical protein
VAVAGIGAAAAVVTGGVGGIDHPSEWDGRVASLAAFVERERGLEFAHPVRVEFLDEAAYSEAARTDVELLSDEDREAIDDAGAILEALGLVPVGTDLFDAANEMVDVGTLAFYEPSSERIIVRGTEMSTGLEVTLVHELVHVAQDQAFDLEQPPDDSPGAVEVFEALVEGDATRIEHAYIESLDGAEQEAYWNEYGAELDRSQAGLAEVPGALQALFAAPYVLGQPMVDLIAGDGGNAAVDEAFDLPPSSAEHLFDPRAYFTDDQPAEVDEPALPDGAEPLGEADVLGATTLFVVLAERIDPLVALSATDGWGGDSYAAYRLDGRTCVRADLVGDTPEDTGEIAEALQAWSQAGPAGAASVEAGDRVRLESCAGPGDASPAAPGSSYDALGLPATRAQLMALGTAGGRGHEESFRMGDCFVRRVPLDVLIAAGDAAEPPPEVAEAIEACAVA